MNIKHNIPLLVGLAIPVAMIVFVAASIYLPRLFIKPQYDFVYATKNYPTYYEKNGDQPIEHRLVVRNGRLLEVTNPVPNTRYFYEGDDRPKLYRYDIQTDTNEELSIEQAQQLSLDDNKKSPDGFEVTYGSDDGGAFPFIFWGGRDYDRRFLKGKNVSHEIEVKASGSYNGFNFIGWVIH